MTGIVDWAASRARMVIAFILLSLVAGGYSYVTLPKEGEPDIEIPVLFVSVPFPGISAQDSEALLVQPMENELSDLDGLKKMTGTASEGYAGLALEFEFGWDKTKVMADVRDAMTRAESSFPSGFNSYSVNEINFSEFPIIIVNLFGDVPERTMSNVADRLKERIEKIPSVLEAKIIGTRDQMMEVLIDPLKLEAYNVTAGEIISVVRNNNQLIAAGNIEGENGAFGLVLPSSFSTVEDIYQLPVKTNGDRVITLGDLAQIKLTFEDASGKARFQGENTIALQIIKRRGFNVIDTTAEIRAALDDEQKNWPALMRATIETGVSNDQSKQVEGMVTQLEGSVLTAIALVMIVVLAALGTRAAFLVGFAVPTSFLLCFALFSVMDVAVSNIVMFGLILAVGMLVDSSIVVVEYADRRIREGSGPMTAYTEAAKRMFWPIVSSTATTLCAFLPMLFWPGVPGQFMGMLPITIIFVLSASLVVALVYLPVLGGVTGRVSRTIAILSDQVRSKVPFVVRAILLVVSMAFQVNGMLQILNPNYYMPEEYGRLGLILGVAILLAASFTTTILMSSLERRRAKQIGQPEGQNLLVRTIISLMVKNPIMPVVTVIAVVTAVGAVFTLYAAGNKGTEFFVETEPEQVNVYVRARGNLSLDEKDALVRQAEEVALKHRGFEAVFAFSESGGLEFNTGGAEPPADSIGTLQIELTPWKDRAFQPSMDGNVLIASLKAELEKIPGIQTEIQELARGPAASKPVHLRLKSSNNEALVAATQLVTEKFENTYGIRDVENSLPLSHIEWKFEVDVEKAGRYGADVQTVGAMIQLITRGILLDTMNVPTSDEEIEIRLRLPKEERLLSTLDSLKLRTPNGLVPLSNFVTRTAQKSTGNISRSDQKRYFDVKAGVTSDLTITKTVDGEEVTIPVTANERIDELTAWFANGALPADVQWSWEGDQVEQAESQAFLGKAFAGALGLMFIILLAQFDSFYNSILVLLAVVLSTTGVLIGMLALDQTFSVIMTGTGIVALAGIVVNNNIVLIDTYQEYARFMPRLDAIVRTVEHRVRPVLLTTLTTMAGLTPMMLGISLDFFSGGYTIDSPGALWWKQLATAVVFGLGVATFLTLLLTPALLAIRVWIWVYLELFFQLLASLLGGETSTRARDMALRAKLKRTAAPEIIWHQPPEAEEETANPDTA